MARHSPRSRHAPAVALVAAALTLLTGCAASDASDPVSTPAPETPPASEAPQAPSVEDPVDVAALATDPCAVLTAEQAEEFNLEAGEAETMTDGDPTCVYRYQDDSGSRVAFIQQPELTNGLSDVYARGDALAVLEPTEIAEHPAAIVQTHQDDRDEGFCSVYVGLTDESVTWLSVQVVEPSDDYPRGCEVGEVLAEAMVETLR